MPINQMSQHRARFLRGSRSGDHRLINDPARFDSRGKRWFWVWLVGLFVLGGVPVPLVGTAYVLDLALPISSLCFLMFSQRARQGLSNEKELFILGGIFVVSFFFLDKVNGIGDEWLFRGLGRNLGFLSSIICGYCVLLMFGMRRFVEFVAAVSLSIPLFLFVVGDPGVFDPATLFKVDNGIFLIIGLSIFVYKGELRKKVIVGLFLVQALLLYLFCNFRSGAVVSLGAVGWYAILPWCRKFAPVEIVCVMIPTLVFGSLGALQYSYKLEISMAAEDNVKRMEASDTARSEMAKDALVQIAQRPFTGYGSWQHVVQNRLNDTGDSFVGVHSFPLQTAYEYGVLGGLLGLWILYLLAKVFGMWTVYGPRILTGGDLLICCFFCLHMLNNYLFGGLMGWGRFFVGVEVAFLLWANKVMRESGFKFFSLSRI